MQRLVQGQDGAVSWEALEPGVGRASVCLWVVYIVYCHRYVCIDDDGDDVPTFVP